MSVSSVHDLMMFIYVYVVFLEHEQSFNAYHTMQSGSLFIILSHFMWDFVGGLVDNLKTESSQGDLNQERW